MIGPSTRSRRIQVCCRGRKDDESPVIRDITRVCKTIGRGARVVDTDEDRNARLAIVSIDFGSSREHPRRETSWNGRRYSDRPR